MTAIDTCPGCGYPKFGADLCAFCQLSPAIDQMTGMPGEDDSAPAAAAG